MTKKVETMSHDQQQAAEDLKHGKVQKQLEELEEEYQKEIARLQQWKQTREDGGEAEEGLVLTHAPAGAPHQDRSREWPLWRHPLGDGLRALDHPLDGTRGCRLHLSRCRHESPPEVVWMRGIDQKLQAALMAKHLLDCDVCLAVLPEFSPVIRDLVLVL